MHYPRSNSAKHSYAESYVPMGQFVSWMALLGQREEDEELEATAAFSLGNVDQ